MQNPDEARRAPRFVTQWPVQISIDGRTQCFGHTYNVSKSGIAIEVENPIKSGSLVDLIVNIPGEPPYALTGMVVGQITGEMSSAPRVSVHLHFIDDRLYTRWQQRVSNLA